MPVVLLLLVLSLLRWGRVVAVVVLVASGRAGMLVPDMNIARRCGAGLACAKKLLLASAAKSIVHEYRIALEIGRDMRNVSADVTAG